jgi:hypothetical protein
MILTQNVFGGGGRGTGTEMRHAPGMHYYFLLSLRSTKKETKRDGTGLIIIMNGTY